MTAHVEPVFLVDLGDAYPNRELVQKLRTALVDAPAPEALYAFGEVIATIARAALIRDAARGDWIEALHEPESGPMYRVAATYWRAIGRWSVSVVRRESDDALAIMLDRHTIHGTPEDTAAEVVDTVLRLAAEWSER